MSRSESRRLPKQVTVRFTPEDFKRLEHEAKRLSARAGRKVSLPEILRESVLARH